MEMMIHNAKDVEYGQFIVNGKVKCVYDMNTSGDLLPIHFEQSDNVVCVMHTQFGQLYYRYKKNQLK